MTALAKEEATDGVEEGGGEEHDLGATGRWEGADGVGEGVDKGV